MRKEIPIIVFLSMASSSLWGQLAVETSALASGGGMSKSSRSLRVTAVIGQAVGNIPKASPTQTSNAGFAGENAFSPQTDSDDDDIPNELDPDNDNDGIEDSLDSDQDGDALLDEWELEHFATLGNIDGTGDADGDSYTDHSEFLFATDPNDASDVFELESTIETDDADTHFRIIFKSSPKRVYRIEVCNTLVKPKWVDSGLGTFTPDPGTETNITLILPSEETRYFFRVLSRYPTTELKSKGGVAP